PMRNGAPLVRGQPSQQGHALSPRRPSHGGQRSATDRPRPLCRSFESGARTSPRTSCAPLFRGFEDVIGGLDFAEALLGFLVALLAVGMMFLREAAVSGPDVLELDVALQA